LFTIFGGRPHCLWCPRIRWNFPVGAFVALKIDKNRLKARKLQPLKGIGSFAQNNFDQTTHSFFPTLSKNP
jgi:hypothetical protein